MRSEVRHCGWSTNVSGRHLVVADCDDHVNPEVIVLTVVRAEERERARDVKCVGGKDFAFTADAADGTAAVQIAGHRHLTQSRSAASWACGQPRQTGLLAQRFGC